MYGLTTLSSQSRKFLSTNTMDEFAVQGRHMKVTDITAISETTALEVGVVVQDDKEEGRAFECNLELRVAKSQGAPHHDSENFRIPSQAVREGSLRSKSRAAKRSGSRRTSLMAFRKSFLCFFRLAVE